MGGGDPFKTLISGKGLPRQARFWNEVVGAAQEHKQGRDTLYAPELTVPDRGEVLIYNGMSGTDLDQYGVLGIGGIQITQTDNPNEFNRIIVLTGRSPLFGATETDRGNFAVALEPIPRLTYGRALICGVVQVQIEVTDTDHKYADVGAATSVKLYSSFGGTARILWQEAGTGTKWAVVHLCQQDAIYWFKAKENWHNGSAAAVTGSSAGTVDCYPCVDEGGNGTDTGTTITIEMPERGERCPNVVTNQIIPAWRMPAHAAGVGAADRYVIAGNVGYDAAVGTLRLTVHPASGAAYGAAYGWQEPNSLDDPQGTATPNIIGEGNYGHFLKMASSGGLEPDVGDTGGEYGGNHTHADHTHDAHVLTQSSDVAATGSEVRTTAAATHAAHSHDSVDDVEPLWYGVGLEIRVDNSK